jgi:hypothetical protein
MDITEQVVQKAASRRTRSLNVPFFQGDVSKEADVEEAVRRPPRRATPARHRGQRRRGALGKTLTETSLEEWNRSWRSTSPACS